MSRYKDAFQIVIGHEGGLTLDPKDRGNWTDGAFGTQGGKLNGTKYGIAAHAHPTLDIRNLTLADAEAIYKREYWDRCNCDQLPDPLALVVFDTAVNSGVGRALDFLGRTRDYSAYLDLRLAFLKSLASWKTYGRGWQNRVDTLRGQARKWAASVVPVPVKPAASDPVILVLKNAPGRTRFRLMKDDKTGEMWGFAIEDGRKV